MRTFYTDGLNDVSYVMIIRIFSPSCELQVSDVLPPVVPLEVDDTVGVVYPTMSGLSSDNYIHET